MMYDVVKNEKFMMMEKHKASGCNNSDKT